jgi:hypothetical protein
LARSKWPQRYAVVIVRPLELYSMDLEHLVESEKLGRRVHASSL